MSSSFPDASGRAHPAGLTAMIERWVCTGGMVIWAAGSVAKTAVYGAVDDARSNNRGRHNVCPLPRRCCSTSGLERGGEGVVVEDVPAICRPAGRNAGRIQRLHGARVLADEVERAERDVAAKAVGVVRHDLDRVGERREAAPAESRIIPTTRVCPQSASMLRVQSERSVTNQRQALVGGLVSACGRQMRSGNSTSKRRRNSAICDSATGR